MQPNMPSDEKARHLDWSAKQGRILTANGKALEYYTAERGFAFRRDELPHYHLLNNAAKNNENEPNDTYSKFRDWASAHRSSGAPSSPIVGAYSRPLFVGQFEHTSSVDEFVYNLQTSTLFVDIRIPNTRPTFTGYSSSSKPPSSLADLTDDELRMYARQHTFAGYANLTSEPYREYDMNGKETTPKRPVCARHHCLDWNFLPGKPRNRPNKWWIELPSDNLQQGNPVHAWKEHSYATDERGQHYYMERWERLEGDEGGKGRVLAMRRLPTDKQQDDGAVMDEIIVVVGDHFSYVRGSMDGRSRAESLYPNASSLVGIVDAAIAAGDRETAESCLSIDAGHGTINTGWTIDVSVRPWMVGQRLFDKGDNIEMKLGDAMQLLWNGSRWEVLECCGIKDVKRGLEQLFRFGQEVEVRRKSML